MAAGYDAQARNNYAVCISINNDFVTNAALDLGYTEGVLRWETEGKDKTVLMDVPSGCVAEVLDTHYARGYFKAPTNTVEFRASDDKFADNSGSVGAALYHAGVFGDKHITDLSISVYNICGLT